jgi:hypothetical protein
MLQTVYAKWLAGYGGLFVNSLAFFVFVGGVRMAGAAMLQTFVLDWTQKIYRPSGGSQAGHGQ